MRAGAKVWFPGLTAQKAAKAGAAWLLGIVPVARAGNNNDHMRAAFGRYIAEAVFWSPAALLPGDNVQWEAIDDSTARVVVRHRGLEQAVDLYVDADGRLTRSFSSVGPTPTRTRRSGFSPLAGTCPITGTLAVSPAHPNRGRQFLRNRRVLRFLQGNRYSRSLSCRRLTGGSRRILTGSVFRLARCRPGC